jgi:DNA-binding CsgD family transcriptional regulator
VPVKTLEIADLLQRWAERETTPRVLVDEELAILWSNPPAERELAKRRDLESRDDTLSVTDPSYQATLASFVGSATSDLSSMCIPCGDGDGHLLFRCREVSIDGGRRFFGMVFYRSGSEYSTVYADLDQVFNLTHAEHRVLLQLLEGHTADQIATGMNVSIETTRSHIRQIYLKLDVTSREGMFSRLRPYRLG